MSGACSCVFSGVFGVRFLVDDLLVMMLFRRHRLGFEVERVQVPDGALPLQEGLVTKTEASGQEDFRDRANPGSVSFHRGVVAVSPGGDLVFQSHDPLHQAIGGGVPLEFRIPLTQGEESGGRLL